MAEPIGRYTMDPITDDDVILESKISPTCTLKHLVCGDASNFWRPEETSVIPDLRKGLPMIREMPVHDDDVFIIAYPKTGSHWVWEIISMLMKGSTQYDSLPKTRSQLEFHYPEEFLELQRPRVFNTHFLHHHIPQQAIDKKCKTVVVQRNPKDTVVSLYYHVKGLGVLDSETSFSHYLAAWLKLDYEIVSNWFYYTKKLQEIVHGQTKTSIYNLYYEDLKADPVSEIRKLATYLGVENSSDDLIKEVAEKCCFKNLKKASELKETEIQGIPKEAFGFMYRKGEVGDWENHFTEAENELFDQTYKEKMKDIKFEYKFNL